jgi:uncharacterized membrane protein
MTPRLRKFVLTAHITFSVGWLGAVAGFLVLAIAGLTSHDVETARGVYLAMDLLYRFIIVPVGLAALVIGLVQALATQWGLFRHYWILVKFLLTVGAGFLMLLHIIAVLKAATRMSAAAPGTLPSAELGPLGTQLVADSGLALLVLLATTALSVYKPWGITQYGRRKQHEETGVRPDRGSTTPWGPYVLLGIFGLALLFVGLHLTGHGLRGH